MLASPAVHDAFPNLEAVRTCSIAVAAARAAGAAIVNPQADSAEGAGAFDHLTDRHLRLPAQRVGHRKNVTRG
jgi:hypothetical protein